MTHSVILLLSTLLAQAPQAVSPVGRSTQQTVKIEGCKGQAGCIAVPVDIGGTSVSATTTCHATTAAPTYVDGTDDPLSCDLAGTLRTSSGGGGGGTVAQGSGSGTAAGFWTMRLSNGVSFLDPRDRNWLLTASDVVDISDRSGRLLGHVTVDNASIPVTGTFWQSTQPVSLASAIDVSDRAARLLGVIYGSQAQQLKQTATNFNTQVEIAVGSGLIDPRSIRALTSSDVVDVSDRTARLLGHVTVDNASLAVTGTFWPTVAASPSSARLSTGAAFYDARDRNWTLLNSTDSVNVGNFPATQPVSGTVTVQGAAADNAAISGNPVPVGYKATADGASITAATAGNVVYPVASTDRRPLVDTGHPNRFNCNVGAATVLTTCQAAPGSGSLYITEIVVSASAAMNIIISAGTGSNCATTSPTTLGPYYLPANAGAVIPFAKEAWKIAATTQLCCKPSAASAFTCTIVGYTAP